MSAPYVARILAMTVAEARLVLQRPQFGDERSIEARDLLGLAEQARKIRARFYPVEGMLAIDRMTAAELHHELAIWEAVGESEDS